MYLKNKTLSEYQCVSTGPKTAGALRRGTAKSWYRIENARLPRSSTLAKQRFLGSPEASIPRPARVHDE